VAAQVRGGETLDAICRNLDLGDSEFAALIGKMRAHFRFHIHPGQSYRAVFLREPGEMRLQSFALEARSGERLHRLDRCDTVPEAPEYAYLEEDVPVQTDTVAVSGVLRGNLFDSFLSLGETPALIDEVTRIFAWDIDFFRDPREGDAFQALIEKRFSPDGRFLGYGSLLGARYENAGRAFDAILYKERFYGADGRSLEKRLMKAPLRFSRISSGFSRSRLHPVLGIRRPHWGVDYAAPSGTPILAAGSGVVAYAKWVGGYGKTIKIRHNGVYSTYYAHLRGYARGISAGRRVSQGQVIGYLGSTGMSTGPHLDYRVEKNGRYINPTQMVSESLQGIPTAERTAFFDHRDQVFALMGVESPVRVASASADSAAGGG
jgi:murein DD-endopeptidase MepM/ murein hydrolase activator NlpD